MINTGLRRATKAAALLPGLAARRRDGDVVVLLYHRIGSGTGEIDVPLRVFERHIAMLADRERVLSLEDALNGQNGGGVVVTFDDGYRDFHEWVVPLLVRHGLPATLYLATGSIDGDAGRTADRLTWSNLRDAVATGLVSVGAHTHTHGDLSRATEGQAEEEMRRSKQLIEENLGVPCRHFAYPYAVGSAAADRVARRLFDSAALHAWRTNRRGRLDPYRLGRTPILRSDGFFFFRAKVAGLLDTEALIYRALGRGPWRYS
jgi:peptidoglycan/xylan/chitin deacetylase (PgdA/CDA1 family)